MFVGLASTLAVNQPKNNWSLSWLHLLSGNNNHDYFQFNIDLCHSADADRTQKLMQKTETAWEIEREIERESEEECEQNLYVCPLLPSLV